MRGLFEKLLNAFTAILMVGVLLVLVVISTGCSRTKVTEDFFQSYQVSPGTVLEIYNPNGPVSVVGTDQEELEITALKETYQSQSALDTVDIFIDLSDILVIETLYPNDTKKVTVSYEIKVPEDVMVSVIECSNGDIDVNQVRGDPLLTTSNGNINVSEVRGTISARSSNGDLTITNVDGLDYLRTSNGNIEADLLAVKENLEIMTSNGSINLYINPELALELEASTSNGEINITNLSLETTLHEQTALLGSMNGGGPLLNIATSNGSIALAQLQ